MAGRVLPVVLLALLAAACGGGAGPADGAGADAGIDPYPFTTPTPPPERTPLDGVFERQVPDELAGPPGKCRRCPPYRLELGDTNTLVIDRGAFLVRHALTGWENVGHVLVQGDRATFFNDPNCASMRGAYRWELEGDRLSLEVIEDECPYSGLRRRYLTATPWTRV